MTIILDLDHTVLNTHKLKKMLAKAGIVYGITPRMFWHAYRMVRKSTLISPRNLIAALPQPVLKKEKIYHALVNAIQNVDAYMYRDAHLFLAFAQREKYRVVVYTYGDPTTQGLKIAGLKKHFTIAAAVVTTKEVKHHDIFKAIPAQGPWVWLDDVPYFPDKSMHINFQRGHYIQVCRKSHMPRMARTDVHVVRNLFQARKYLTSLSIYAS